MKYAVKLHYTTYLYEEVEADSIEDAVEKAKCTIDDYEDEKYRETIVDNLSYDEASVSTIDENGFASVPTFV